MAATKYSVDIKDVISELSLNKLVFSEKNEGLKIVSAEINRPGLHLAGYYEYFDQNRIQIIGKAEFAYLDTHVQRNEKLKTFFSKKPDVVIISRGLEPYPEMLSYAEEFEVALLSTADSTSTFMAGLIAYLNVQLAPRITRHGVLVEVYGEGVLITGDSGVGKSETAIELIKRGHRFIADDAVEIRRVSNKTLVGSSPENIRHYMEVRGVGIINARRLFGVGAVKITEKIDLVISLENWDSEKIYDRMGMDNEMISILNVEVPSMTIPIKPGRNLAIIIEVAAMNNRHKKLGYNAAKELLENLGMKQEEPEKHIKEFDIF